MEIKPKLNFGCNLENGQQFLHSSQDSWHFITSMNHNKILKSHALNSYICWLGRTTELEEYQCQQKYFEFEVFVDSFQILFREDLPNCLIIDKYNL